MKRTLKKRVSYDLLAVLRNTFISLAFYIKMAFAILILGKLILEAQMLSYFTNTKANPSKVRLQHRPDSSSDFIKNL